MDLDEYSPLEDSPSPAERTRQPPLTEGKRGRGDRKQAQEDNLANEIEEVMEKEDMGRMVSHMSTSVTMRCRDCL